MTIATHLSTCSTTHCNLVSCAVDLPFYNTPAVQLWPYRFWPCPDPAAARYGHDRHLTALQHGVPHHVSVTAAEYFSTVSTRSSYKALVASPPPLLSDIPPRGATLALPRFFRGQSSRGCRRRCRPREPRVERGLTAVRSWRAAAATATHVWRRPRAAMGAGG